MRYLAKADTAKRREFPGAVSDWIFPEGDSPAAGFSAMRNFFTSTEFPEAGIHKDHEGFYVLAGEGEIRIDREDYPISAGTAILVPAGVPHAIRKCSRKDLEIFIFHFPVRKEESE